MVRLCLILLLSVANAAYAAESAPVKSARLTASLVSDTDAVEAGRPFKLGLRLRMAPGWHTYWQNPGDAGTPPELTLTLPAGTTAGPIVWPTPLRQAEGPVMTYAYTGDLLLPLTVTPGEGAQSIVASASWLVCAKICVPEEGQFTLDLPQGAPTASVQAPLFAAAVARTPRPSPFAASIAPNGTMTLSGDGLSAASVKDAWFFPDTWGLVEQAAAQAVTVRDGAVQIGLHPADKFTTAASVPGVLVLRDPAGQESYLAVDAKRGPAPDGGATLPRVLLLAFAGGVLLNLMPCVFPVLAMKAMALARMSGQARSEARADALSYTVGVLLAFAALGAALLAARAAGEASGWGFQFQSPVFVAAMAWLLFLVGLNLSGVFAVETRLAGVGSGLASRGGWVGSLFTGVLAVLVATPCTAPFMGVAIAAALAAQASVTVLVFGVMGLGMAMPFLLLGLFPAWARILPRPGAWMDVLRGVLAFPMYGAAAWLIWVVSLEAGPQGVLASVAGLVLLGFGAWAFGMAQRATRGRRLGLGVALAAGLAAAVILAAITPAAEASGTEARADDAERYTPGRLAALHDEGRPVFVNMTAAWCVTCLVNERVALSPRSVRAAFARHRVAYLKGDWTRGDAVITQFLRENGRDGVPLYVLFPPGNAAPLVLPQILTEADILSQLDKFGG